MIVADHSSPRALRLMQSIILAVPLAAPVAAAHDANAGRGLAFARTHCARCHMVAPRGGTAGAGRSSPSPMREAPPFRELAGRIPIDDLADFLVEGIAFRHPAMPEFRLDPDDASDLTAYLESLRR